jgi:glycosyltransferase involved in cell wall biosynthesis
MGYTLSTLKVINSKGFNVHLIHWDKKKLTPFEIDVNLGFDIYPKSNYTYNSLKNLVDKINPDLVYVSGWQDKDYLKICYNLRKKKNKIAVGFDDQWNGTIKQKFASILGYLGFFKLFYSHAWISGFNQFEYAKRLGFKKEDIIYDLLSADLSLFQKAFDLSHQKKTQSYPHRFLYVGRFEKIKGIDILLNAWNSIENYKGWELCLIGSGSYKINANNYKNLIVKDFLQPDLLVKEIANCGFFILPSKFEPWGVVVHEFAAAGLPLLLTYSVGAASTFLIPGYNGYILKNNNIKDLTDILIKVINTNDIQLVQMMNNSNELSKRISPITSFHNLISMLD